MFFPLKHANLARISLQRNRAIKRFRMLVHTNASKSLAMQFQHISSYLFKSSMPPTCNRTTACLNVTLLAKKSHGLTPGQLVKVSSSPMNEMKMFWQIFLLSKIKYRQDGFETRLLFCLFVKAQLQNFFWCHKSQSILNVQYITFLSSMKIESTL